MGSDHVLEKHSETWRKDKVTPRFVGSASPFAFPIFPSSLLPSSLLTFSLQLLSNDPLSFLSERPFAAARGKCPRAASPLAHPSPARAARKSQPAERGPSQTPAQQERSSARLPTEKHPPLKTRRSQRAPRLPRPDTLGARSRMNRRDCLPARRRPPAGSTQVPHQRFNLLLQPRQSQVTQLHRQFAAKTARQLSDRQETSVLLQERQLCHRGNGSAC